jgi:hypothetical protein
VPGPNPQVGNLPGHRPFVGESRSASLGHQLTFDLAG